MFVKDINRLFRFLNLPTQRCSPCVGFMFFGLLYYEHLESYNNYHKHVEKTIKIMV